MLLEEKVIGSRSTSNLIIGSVASIGGVGFSLAASSSYLGKNLLPVGNPSTLLFVPQGLIMGIYGVFAILLAIYIWFLYAINFGGGINKFDKNAGVITISRRALFKEITIEIPIKDVQAVKLQVREGLNPKRSLSLRLRGMRDIPITRPGQPIPIIELEKNGAELAKFLEVNIEGSST